MNSTKTETIDNFKIKYKKHIFSKSIKITLKDEKNLLVTMPLYCPFKKARDFLIANLEKIQQFKFKKNYYTKDFKTKFDTLKIITDKELKTFTQKNIVYFHYPNHIDFNSDLIQENLSIAHKKALKIEAKNYLIPRLDFLAKKYNFSYSKVSLKNQKTRFGSCSYNNNINLNINLMNYDFDVIDYVLIHELVHTKIKNHSNAFWKEVEKYCPNYQILRKQLKNINFY